MLFCSSGERLEPVLGYLLKKITGNFEKIKKARRKKEIGGKQYCLEAKNKKYWEDGVHLLHFFGRRGSMAQRYEDHVRQVSIRIEFGIFAATSEQIKRFEISRDTPGPEVSDLYDSSISTLKCCFTA